MKRQIIVHPGQKVIANDGKVYTVAYANGDKVFAFGSFGQPYRIIVCGDAWGYEYDQEIGIAA